MSGTLNKTASKSPFKPKLFYSCITASITQGLKLWYEIQTFFFKKVLYVYVYMVHNCMMFKPKTLT